MKIMIMTDLEGPSGINGRMDGIGNKTSIEPSDGIGSVLLNGNFRRNSSFLQRALL